jgi:hypothetical protein
VRVSAGSVGGTSVRWSRASSILVLRKEEKIPGSASVGGSVGGGASDMV